MREAALALLLLATPLRGTEFTGKVVAVEDGDTIDVLHDGRAEKLRLNGIDCPELGQAYGKRSREFAARLVFGQEVCVIVQGRDAYGRTVAQVVAPDGRSLNRELVRVGLAWWYYSFAPKDEDLERLQAAAQASKVGLWADANPTAPWHFRDALARSYRAPAPRPPASHD